MLADWKSHGLHTVGVQMDGNCMHVVNRGEIC